MSKIEELLKIFTNNSQLQEEKKQAIYDYILLKSDKFPELGKGINDVHLDFPLGTDDVISSMKKAKENEKEYYRRFILAKVHYSKYYKVSNGYNVCIYYYLENSVKTALFQYIKDNKEYGIDNISSINFFIEFLLIYSWEYKSRAENEIKKSFNILIDEIKTKNIDELLNEYQNNNIYIVLYMLCQLIIHKKDKKLALRLVDIINKIETREDIILKNILYSLFLILDVCDEVKNKFTKLLENNKYLSSLLIIRYNLFL